MSEAEVIQFPGRSFYAPINAETVLGDWYAAYWFGPFALTMYEYLKLERDLVPFPGVAEL